MCGRYSLRSEVIFLKGLRPEGSTPRYNITPRSQVPVLCERSNLLAAGLLPPTNPASMDTSVEHEASTSLPDTLICPDFIWGFSDNTKTGLLINARSETAGRLASFRESMKARRCAIPADGFYEWQNDSGSKQ